MKQVKQPLIHIVIFCLFLSGALFMFYLTEQQLRALGRAQASANSLSDNQSKLVSLESSLPGLSSLSASWLKTLPANEKDVAAFATQIESLAKTQGLTVALSLDDFPGPVDVLGHYVGGLGAQITLEGSYAGTTNFLANLTNLPYFFKIDKMTLTKPETKNGVKAVLEGALIMNIKI